MEPFRYHVYLCDQKKPDGAPCCSARGSATVLEALRRELGTQNLNDVVQVTTCGSLGLCERGPNLVVYPEGVWYSAVLPADVPELVREHFKNGKPLDRLINRDASAVKAEVTLNRGKMMAAMKARDKAGTVPDELMAQIRCYQESRIVLTALELDVFTVVSAGATVADVARKASTDPRATEALLNALTALGLLTKQDSTYACTAVATRYLKQGAPDDSRMSLKHNLRLWRRWSTLTECVRTGFPVGTLGPNDNDEEGTEAFIAAMHKNAALRAPVVLAAVGTTGIKKVIDIGGGSGAYAIALAQAQPEAAVELLDVSAVVPIAKRHIEAAGLSGRIRVRTGDLRTDDFGADFDLALLSAICHMLGPQENQNLLTRIGKALRPGGRLVIQDHIMAPDKTAPRAGALFAINMLVGTEAGSTYSQEEYARWLKAAGFGKVDYVKLMGPNDLMIGTR